MQKLHYFSEANLVDYYSEKVNVRINVYLGCSSYNIPGTRIMHYYKNIIYRNMISFWFVLADGAPSNVLY